MDFKQISSVKGLFVPNKQGEYFGADVLVQRGAFTLLVRYQYKNKEQAKIALKALQARDVKSMPRTDLPQQVYILDNQKVR